MYLSLAPTVCLWHITYHSLLLLALSSQPSRFFPCRSPTVLFLFLPRHLRKKRSWGMVCLGEQSNHFLLFQQPITHRLLRNQLQLVVASCTRRGWKGGGVSPLLFWNISFTSFLSLCQVKSAILTQKSKTKQLRTALKKSWFLGVH